MSELEDDIVVRANMTALERRQMHDVIGRDVAIAPPQTNGDAWNTTNPAAIAILDQIQAACDERDREMAEYNKAEPIASRASSKAMEHYRAVQRANDRALKLRDALTALREAVR